MKTRLKSDAILYVAILFAMVVILSVSARGATTQPTISATPTKWSPPSMRLVKQASNHIAYEIPPGAANWYLENTTFTAGGIVKATDGAYSLTLKNVTALKPPSGGGNYVIIAATKPVESLIVDNSDLRKTSPNSDDFINGSEAAARIMGGAVDVRFISCNFRNSKHDFYDPTGIMRGTPGIKQTWWKQVEQYRDAKSVAVIGGRTIGLIDCGEQKNTSLTPQHLDLLTFEHHQMTNLPSVTDWRTVGKIVFIACPKIDEQGKFLGYWPDATWTAAKH